MSDRSVTLLKDRRTGELVEAALIDGVSREDVESTESAWRPFLKARRQLRINASGTQPLGLAQETRGGAGPDRVPDVRRRMRWSNAGSDVGFYSGASVPNQGSEGEGTGIC